MRAVFNQQDLDLIFRNLREESGFSWVEIADSAKISVRTLNSWRNGQTSIPVSFLDSIKNKYGFECPIPKHLISISSIKSTVGKLGGKRRMELYGNLGTKEGRKRGGINSVKKQQTISDSPFARKNITLPKHSKEFAEFIGILLGDGGITSRQISITLHKRDDKKYTDHVALLIKKVFGIYTVVRPRRTANVNTIIISRTSLVDYFKSIGLKRGNKVRNQVRVPEWIRADDDFKTSCLRGLFDTDGCFFDDSHVIKGKRYQNPGMNFTNHSLPLLMFFKNTLEELGFRPKQTSQYSVFLRREDDIVGYFQKVGSSNSKHFDKFEKYFKSKYGRVPKRS